MRLHFKGLGFPNLDKKLLEELTKEIYEEPDKRYVIGVGENETYAEFIKFYGKDFGIKISCIVLDKEDEVNIFDIDTFIENGEKISICDVFFDSTKTVEMLGEDESPCYAVCEESETGIELEFTLQNTIDHKKLLSDEDVFANEAKISAIALAGTIVLPIEKNLEDNMFEHDYQNWYREQLQKARLGDSDADAVLDNEFYEASEEIYERLKNEDFLSVVEGYLYHDDEKYGIYFVLGDILKIEVVQNTKTEKEVYKLLVRIMNISMNVYISKDDIVGFPIVGMRFIGVCRLQGEVCL